MNSGIKEQIVITGPGRSGTTFLIELLTHLGLDTGFKVGDLIQEKDHQVNAGLEKKVGSPEGPYIVKDPWFCDYVSSVFQENQVRIKHIFIPIRDLRAIAESRRTNNARQLSGLSLIDRIKYRIWPYPLMGGLWDTQSRAKGVQERILAEKLANLLLEVAKHQIPVTFIQFPLLIHSSEYLYEKLIPILGDLAFDTFESTFRQVVKPDLLHQY